VKVLDDDFFAKSSVLGTVGISLNKASVPFAALGIVIVILEFPGVVVKITEPLLP
jgi:hypothetical protein